MRRERSADVVVVGAGIIGLTAAWRALEAGARVTVLDPSPGGGATHAAAGMLGPAMEAEYGEEHLARISRRSVARWPDFAAGLERAAGLSSGALGLDRTGTLAVAFDADDAALLDRRLELHRDLGLRARRRTVAAARDHEPTLGPRIAAAAWLPDDHQVDPRAVHRALLTVVRDHPDATLLPRRVTSLLPAREATPDTTVLGARDDQGTDHPAGLVVLAAGYASAALHTGAPTRPVPGTTLRLSAEATAGPSVVVRGTVQGRPVYVVPRAPGADGRREIVVGATSDERAATTRTRAGDVFALLRDARALLPGLDEAELVETTTRSRPGTPDNAPLVGLAAPGLFLATGHYRGGVLLTPYTADVLDAHLDPRSGGSPGQLHLVGSTGPRPIHTPGGTL